MCVCVLSFESEMKRMNAQSARKHRHRFRSIKETETWRQRDRKNELISICPRHKLWCEWCRCVCSTMPETIVENAVIRERVSFLLRKTFLDLNVMAGHVAREMHIDHECISFLLFPPYPSLRASFKWRHMIQCSETSHSLKCARQRPFHSVYTGGRHTTKMCDAALADRRIAADFNRISFHIHIYYYYCFKWICITPNMLHWFHWARQKRAGRHSWRHWIWTVWGNEKTKMKWINIRNNSREIRIWFVVHSEGARMCNARDSYTQFDFNSSSCTLFMNNNFIRVCVCAV